MQIVKDVVMYQATTRDYKVGDIIKFGDDYNYQAKRVLDVDYKMENAPNNMPEMLLEEKIKHHKKLNKNELREVCDILWNYGFSMREIGLEICRQRYYPNEPSRFKCMFLCKKPEEAKCYLSTAKTKGNTSQPKVIGVKLNGKILMTSNSFNMRGGKSINEFIEQAHAYWQGVDDSFVDKASIEYLFEGIAEVVEIINE